MPGPKQESFLRSAVYGMYCARKVSLLNVPRRFKYQCCYQQKTDRSGVPMFAKHILYRTWYSDLEAKAKPISNFQSFYEHKTDRPVFQ